LIKANSKQSLTLESKTSDKTQICFPMIKSQFFFVTKDEQTIYSFQRMVKAFKIGVHSVTKSFKAQSTHKTVFCYHLKTNNRLNVRINQLFWFDSKSTTKNSFQTFSKHLRVKQSVVSTKQHVVFHLV